MPLDRVVAKTVWDGKVPCVLALASSDLTSFRQPDPLYLMLPRCSFFPLHINDRMIRTLFSEFIGKLSDTDEYWLESNDVPLKWHIPIGVQFDLLSKQPSVPWNISIHFRNFPTNKLVRFTSEEDVQSHFMSMIKQTDYAKVGSSNRIMQLPKNDQMQLWEGFKTLQFDLFWAINMRLISDGATDLKKLPVRIYLDATTTLLDTIPPQTLSGRLTVLLDVLRRCLPNLFPTPPGTPLAFPVPVKKSAVVTEAEGDDGTDGGETPKSAENEASKTASTEALPTPPAQSAPGSFTAAELKLDPSLEVLVHGIRPALDMPLVWMSDNLSHPDNLLHIIVKKVPAASR